MVLGISGVLIAIFGWVLRHERAISTFRQWKETTTARLMEDDSRESDFAEWARERIRTLEIAVLGRKR
jgi:hypothetical protein